MISVADIPLKAAAETELDLTEWPFRLLVSRPDGSMQKVNHLEIVLGWTPLEGSESDPNRRLGPSLCLAPSVLHM